MNRFDSLRSAGGAVWLRRGLLLLALFLVYGPLATLTSGLLLRGAELNTGRLELLRLALPLEQRGGLYAKSLGISFGAAFLASLSGLLAALATWRWRGGWRGFLRWLPLALVAVPPYVHALAWSSTIQRINLRLDPLNLMIPKTGQGTAAWVMAMTLLPWAYGACSLALALIPRTQVEAARLSRPDAGVIRRIVLPLAGPLIAAGMALGFLLALLDYSIPALFQVNVLALAVFADYSASADASRALAMSLPLMLAAALATFWLQRGWRAAALSPTGQAESESGWLPLRLPLLGKGLLGLGLLTLLMQAGVMLLSLILGTGSWNRYVGSVGPSLGDLGYSLALACAIALISLPFALPWAMRLAERRSPVSDSLWWALVVLPLAMPAPLVGIGLIRLWNGGHLADLGLYGTDVMPVLASLARFLPVAAVVLAAQLRRLDPELVDAARVHQSGSWAGWRRVRLPIMLPGLAAAAGIVFALSLGELGATLLVMPPGRNTLTVRTFNYLHFGASDAVAGLCLTVALISTIVATATLRVFRLGLRRSGKRASE